MLFIASSLYSLPLSRHGFAGAIHESISQLYADVSIESRCPPAGGRQNADRGTVSMRALAPGAAGKKSRAL